MQGVTPEPELLLEQRDRAPVLDDLEEAPLVEPVELVADDAVPQRGQVRADLVLSPGPATSVHSGSFGNAINDVLGAAPRRRRTCRSSPE